MHAIRLGGSRGIPHRPMAKKAKPKRASTRKKSPGKKRATKLASVTENEMAWEDEPEATQPLHDEQEGDAEEEELGKDADNEYREEDY